MPPPGDAWSRSSSGMTAASSRAIRPITSHRSGAGGRRSVGRCARARSRPGRRLRCGACHSSSSGPGLRRGRDRRLSARGSARSAPRRGRRARRHDRHGGRGRSSSTRSFLLGNNVGFLGGEKQGRRLLRKLVRLSSAKGRILAGSYDPYEGTSELARRYQARNRDRGKMGGVERLRVRYRQYATPWYDVRSCLATRSHIWLRRAAGRSGTSSTTARLTSPCSISLQAVTGSRTSGWLPWPSARECPLRLVTLRRRGGEQVANDPYERLRTFARTERRASFAALRRRRSSAVASAGRRFTSGGLVRSPGRPCPSDRRSRDRVQGRRRSRRGTRPAR